MAGGGLGRSLGTGLLLMLGIGIAGAGALGLPQQWLAAAGLDPTAAHRQPAAPDAAALQAAELLVTVQQREAAVQARELSLGQKERAALERELAWVRTVQKLSDTAENEASAQVAALLEKMPPRQVAERLAGLDDAATVRIFLLLSENQAAAVLGQLSPQRSTQLITELGKGGGRG